MLNITITEQTPSNMLRAIRAACNELLGETHADLTTQAAQHNIRAEELRVAAERELDKSASCLTAHTAERQVAANPALAASYGQGGPVDAGQFYRVGEQPSEQTVLAAAFDKAVEATGAQHVARALVDSVETDSSGAEWNPELHASTKAKNQDGTWKKRRGAGSLVAQSDSAAEPATQAVAGAIAANPGATQIHDEVQAPALPPLPPTAPVPPAPTAEEDMRKVYALITSGICTLNDAIDGAKSRGFADLGAFSRDATPEQRAQLLAELTKEVA